ncbi:MAG: hypothetical protein LCH59_00550 [Proteobacteria bacterium]|nr:hypothetical protein [Pseudomonadota bacterium]
MVKNPRTGRWAARRAAELEQQAASIDGVRDGNWRAAQRRRAAAARLRSQAARFRGLAARHDVELDAHLPF